MLNPFTPTVVIIWAVLGTAIKHPVPDRVEPSFVIFDIQALWRSALSVKVPGCQKLQMTVQPGLAFVIFDIQALWRSALSVKVPGCQKLQMTAQPGLAQDALCNKPIAVSIWNSGHQTVNLQLSKNSKILGCFWASNRLTTVSCTV